MFDLNIFHYACIVNFISVFSLKSLTRVIFHKREIFIEFKFRRRQYLLRCHPHTESFSTVPRYVVVGLSDVNVFASYFQMSRVLTLFRRPINLNYVASGFFILFRKIQMCSLKTVDDQFSPFPLQILAHRDLSTESHVIKC